MLFVSTEIYLNEDTSITNICNTCILDCRYKISKKAEDKIFERAKTETQEQIASDYNITRRRVAKVVGREQSRISQVEDISIINTNITYIFEINRDLALLNKKTPALKEQGFGKYS
ncbi:hypothetical protein ES705_44826 [subsurface metagenome]